MKSGMLRSRPFVDGDKNDLFVLLIVDIKCRMQLCVHRVDGVLVVDRFHLLNFDSKSSATRKKLISARGEVSIDQWSIGTVSSCSMRVRNTDMPRRD